MRIFAPLMCPVKRTWLGICSSRSEEPLKIVKTINERKSIKNVKEAMKEKALKT